MDRLNRIEQKLDVIADRISGVELELAKQEWKIIRRLSVAFAGLASLIYTFVNLWRASK